MNCRVDRLKAILASAPFRSGLAVVLIAGAMGVFAAGCRRVPSAEPGPDRTALANEPRGSNPDPVETPPDSPKQPASPPEVFRSRDKVSFLGTHGVGKRFCIIADASNSMRGGPIDQLKREIMQTLGNMKPTSQFYVIFFNATDIPMPYPSP